MPQIETLILANHAESQNGLLYLMGGGWTDLNQVVMPGQPAPPFHMGIGLTILIPWTETNRRHHVTMLLEREDGGEPIIRLEADMETGRPPGAVEGADQRLVVAFNAEVQFPGLGATGRWQALGQDHRSQRASE